MKPVLSITPEELSRAVGHHLVVWQKRKGYNQSDMADALKVTTSYYNRMTFGVGSINLEMLCRISEVTGMKPYELICPIKEQPDLGRKWKTSEIIGMINTVKQAVLDMEEI